MRLRNLYYATRFLIPDRLYVAARRFHAGRMRRLHHATWPIDPAAMTPPPGWPGWPDGKRFALVLTHDVERDKGCRRCEALAALEEKEGFRSSFNFVPERYQTPPALREKLVTNGFEVGVHGLKHDGKLYRNRATFLKRSRAINRYLHEWHAVGYRAPSMHHNLAWQHALEIEYDASTFDTDPFEPQPDALGTIFPRWIPGPHAGGYVELPYTLVQDSTLFLFLEEKDTSVWEEKIAWLAEQGGMALLITHPDYMALDEPPGLQEYPAEHYVDFLRHLKEHYAGQYWHALPRDVARFSREQGLRPHP